MQWLKDFFCSGVLLVVYYITGNLVLDWLRFFKIFPNLDVGLVCAMLVVICLHIRREREFKALAEQLKVLEGKNGELK